MLTSLFRQLHDGINHLHKASRPLVNLGLFLVLADLVHGQTRESCDRSIERRDFVSRHIISDLGRFLAEGIGLGVPATHLVRFGSSLSPKAEAAHKALELPYAVLPGAFGLNFNGLFSGLSVASGLQNVQEVTNRTSSDGRDNDPSVFVWHIVWVVLSGCLGWIAYGFVREWQIWREAKYKSHNDRHPNTYRLYMTYIV